MANADAAFGLRPVRSRGTPAYTGGGIKGYAFDTSTALAIGDPVVFSGTGEAATGVPTFQRAAAVGPIDGVIVGMLSDPGDDVLTRDNPRVIAADTASGAFVLVETNPDVIYHVQEDSVGVTLAVTNIGQHIALTQSAPDAVNGVSSVELDSSTAGNTTTGLAVKIVGLAELVDNSIGANAIWEVTINATNWRGAGAQV